MSTHSIEQRKDYWHIFFYAGLVLRSLNGLWETVVGALVLYNRDTQLGRLLEMVAWKELQEDPKDSLINFLVTALNSISFSAKLFIGAYFLLHGLLNIFLAVQLVRHRLWAYKLALAVIFLSIGYQLYRLAFHSSWFLAALTAFDIIFLLLIHHEYRHHRSRVASKQSL